MVAKVTEICRWLIIYVKTYFTSVHLSVHYVSVNIPLIQDMEHTKFIQYHAYKNLPLGPFLSQIYPFHMYFKLKHHMDFNFPTLLKWNVIKRIQIWLWLKY